MSVSPESKAGISKVWDHRLEVVSALLLGIAADRSDGDDADQLMRLVLYECGAARTMTMRKATAPTMQSSTARMINLRLRIAAIISPLAVSNPVQT